MDQATRHPARWRNRQDVDRSRPGRLLVLLLLCSVAGPPLALWAHMAQGPAPGRSDTLPLTPTRTIEFTTDEGTWMSVDVSPDGRTLVFDLLGDLYALPIEGGTARRITEGPAFDGQPRFSPDGTTIVFTSDRSGSENLWLADRDGTHARALTRDEDCRYTSPEWTPDGADIVASQDCSSITKFGKRNLLVVHTNGAPAARLTPAPFDHYLGAAFGPDARYLYVAGKRGGFAYFQPLPIWQIGVLDRVTEKLTVLTTADGSAMRPVVSPDGKTMVYATRVDTQTALKVRDLTTGDETWLAVGMPRDEQESRSNLDTMPGSAFTPDGKQLVTSFGGRLWRMEVPSGRVVPIPFTAEVKQYLGPLPHADATIGDALTVQHIRDGRLSPDGRQFAFTALDKIWLMDLPSGQPRRLTRADASVGEFEPAWSPDGRFLAYVTWTQNGGEVYRVAASGQSPPERLSTRPAAYRRFVYTPDGTKLVGLRGAVESRLTRGVDSQVALVSMAAGGGAADALKTTSVDPPQFTRDGRLYLANRREGLVSMRADGTNRTPHLKVTGVPWEEGGPPEEASASQIVVSPDGTRALAIVNYDLFLVAIPTAGGPAPTVSVVHSAADSEAVTRITGPGAEFPAWRADGREFSYSVGHSVFICDLVSGGGERPAGAPAPQAFERRRVDIQIVVPRDKPAGSVVLRDARLITMRGDQIIEHGDLVVTDNRIAGVGARGTVPIPSGAKVIDVAGTTILPGWVDIHAHIDPPTELHVSQAWEYLVTLAYGVTTVRIPNSHGTDVFSYADRIETGEILGPRVTSTGLAMGPPSWAGRSTLEDARDLLRPYAEFWQTRMIKQVRDRQPEGAAIDQHGRTRVRADGDGRRQHGSEDVHHGHPGWLSRPRALLSDCPDLPGCGRADRPIGDDLRPDAHRQLWRADCRGVLLRARGRPRERETAPVHAASDH